MNKIYSLIEDTHEYGPDMKNPTVVEKTVNGVWSRGPNVLPAGTLVRILSTRQEHFDGAEFTHTYYLIEWVEEGQKRSGWTRSYSFDGFNVKGDEVTDPNLLAVLDVLES